MFTGIIKFVGSVRRVARLGVGREVWVEVPDIGRLLEVGDSVAVNGICSTVTAFANDWFRVQYLKETLNRTTMNKIKSADLVNIELSLRASDRMGGHLVSGHVDDVGQIIRLDFKRPWAQIEVEFSESWAPLVIEKGSIALDGIGLTISHLTTTTVRCDLIPHTIQHTTLRKKKVGQPVNIEFDCVGKYLYRFSKLGNTPLSRLSNALIIPSENRMGDERGDG